MAAVSPTATSRRRPALDPWAPIWRLLTSVRIAVFYIGALVLFGLAGVLIPQIPEPMRGNETAVDAWVETQRGTFGPFTDLMHALGLFSVFQARWFLFALAFLVLFVTTCTFNRWAPTFRNVFRPPARVPDSFFERAHNRTEMAPVTADGMRGALRSMRFGRVDFEQRDGATYLFADRYAWTQLSTFVSHLALILFLAGGLVTWATGFTASRFAGEGTTFPVFAVSDPGQLQVRVDDAVGSFGDLGNPLDYRTHLTIFKNGQEVKSGYTTVNNPLSYDGYRFHQAAYWPDGAALRITDTRSGYTVFHETFPLEDITAAPVVRITDPSGRELISDTIAPTDFLSFASGAVVLVPQEEGEPRPLWIGITAKNHDDWVLVAYDPSGDKSGQQLRIDEGGSARLAGLTIAFEDVAALPAAVGIDLPDGSARVLAQMVEGPDGDDALMLVAENRPAISLAKGQPVAVGQYEYAFEGTREFTGISVKRDSGAWFIWVATGMLVIGLAITFYIPRRRLWIRLTPEKTQIAALAEKSGGFEGDMRTLSRRLGVETPADMREET